MMHRSAKFSPCRRYRYTLWRHWGGLTGYVAFIGLNPSTATETLDDPTIRRCMHYAQDWGFSGLCMLNIFAFRATLPKDMKAEPEPIGPENDLEIHLAAAGAAMVVAAWGTHGKHLDRDRDVRLLVPKLHHLKLNSDGTPGHPLYLRKTLMPIPWEPLP